MDVGGCHLCVFFFVDFLKNQGESRLWGAPSFWRFKVFLQVSKGTQNLFSGIKSQDELRSCRYRRNSASQSSLGPKKQPCVMCSMLKKPPKEDQ